ncbi:hypothetical protein B0H11DRAFT_1858528 [Mycena galericulata]|nr:hypothetical protein B0H11DRAFT_1858528 [Mycena galericulata]
MVVTRKTPVAPVPTGSRTNSTQPLPRAAKAKTSSTLAESEPVLAKDSPVAAAKNAASSQKPPTKSKHKNKHHKKAPKPPSGLLDRLVYLSLSLLVLYAFITCPQEGSLSNPVCRSLSQYRIHVLEPYVLPPIHKALAHPSVAPYVARAEHLERTTLRPAVLKTARITAPYAAAAKRVVWDRTVVPAYTAYVLPRVLPPYNRYIAPKIAQAAPYAARTQRALEDTAFVLHKAYTQRVQPAALKAYAFAEPWAIRAWRAARPHALALAAQGKVWASLAAAKAGEARRAYVDPHVVRIWDKVLELSGAGPVGGPTEQGTLVPVTFAEETAATTGDSTTEAVVIETSVAAAVTPVEASSSTPSVTAVEEVPTTTPTATASSSSAPPPAETTSVVETDIPVAEVEPELSAASVAVQSAHGTEPSVVSEIVEDVKSKAAKVAASPEKVTPSPEKVATPSSSSAPPPAETASVVAPKVPAGEVEAEIFAASVAAQSAHGMESPVVEQIIEDIKHKFPNVDTAAPVHVPEAEPEQEEEDDGMNDFLADIGLNEPVVEDNYEEEEQLTPAERHALERQQAEEQAEAKLRQTAEKRADLEGRMAASNEALGAMVKEKNKQLRKALVGLRKAAVAKMDDPQTVIGGQLPGLEKEADKLFKGLEGYVKKEAKNNKVGDNSERMDRWITVVGKVEEKLQEKVASVQNAIQQYHVDLKASEVNEGMAIIQQVKDACSQAQADVGLELSWLHDVTYHDWNKYHDLARIGEKFQKDASEIQAGTHAHPPVDPFIPRLQKMQDDFTSLVDGFVTRLNALRQQAEVVFALGTGVEDGSDESAEEPEVSILPIDPDAELPLGDVPPPVVIGKSPQQVLQALENVETTPPHNEL